MSRIGTSSSGGAQPANNGFATGTPSQVAVSTASTQLFPANSNRKYAHLFNNSGQTIFIQYASPAVLNQGVRIMPNTFFTIESTNLWLGAINAIAFENNVLIDILEGE